MELTNSHFLQEWGALNAHLPASAGFSTRLCMAQDEGDNLKAMAAALHKESGTVEDAISRQEDAKRVGWQIDDAQIDRFIRFIRVDVRFLMYMTHDYDLLRRACSLAGLMR